MAHRFDRSPSPFVHEGLLRLDRVPNDVTFERIRAGLTSASTSRSLT